MPLEALKLELIRKIMDEQDESRLHAIEATLAAAHQSDQEELLRRIAKPTRRKLDIEELKREQNWRPIDKESFFKKIEDLAIEEPLDELIEMIGK